MTVPIEPRCWKTLTRKRPTPMIVWAVSSSFSASKRSRRLWVRIRYTISRICSLSTRPSPSIGRSEPSMRIAGGS